jgi:vacuolar protein-sorting-associated protein 4
MKALARESNLSFFPITTASLISKYVGDSAKNIKSMFEVIKSIKPCILFIDEINALCVKRDTDSQQSSESLKAVDEFLIQLDGITKDDMSRVLLVGATNLPWKIDPGVLRRFNRKIYIPLPTLEDRYALLRYYSSLNDRDIGPGLSEQDLWTLSDKTLHFSGSDIKNLIQTAHESTIELIINATHFKASPKDNQDFYIIPCAEDDPSAKKRTYDEIKDKSKIRSPALTLDHISSSLLKIKPSVNQKKIQKYETWTVEYGEKA